MKRRSIVLNFDELHEDMIRLIGQSRLNVLGLHNWDESLRFDLKINRMIDCMNSKQGKALIEKMKSCDVDIEYEIHALSWLLPRDMFDSRPELFRMNEKGERVPDANCCVTHPESLAIIQENSVTLAKQLPPTSNRYFLWQDDTKPWCHCANCRDLSSSDQNLWLMNHILEALKSVNPQAELAFLAYMETLRVVPSQIQPAEGIFLEITGPVIHHQQEKDLQSAHANALFQRAVSDQLQFFGAKGAHVLEYWMDVSLYSNWTKPAVKLPFDPEKIRKDLQYYASLGIESAASFGCFTDQAYFEMYGEPPIVEYSRLLEQASRPEQAGRPGQAGRPAPDHPA